ncbi:MAG: ester cyclase [Acetobacteraceae bacterium]|nr:ester cyclase [Microbispora sp.]MDI3308399.1 ester cyclase [Acetobacteraceae bacterium]
MSDASDAPGARDPGDAVPPGVAAEVPAPLTETDEQVLHQLQNVGDPTAGGAPPHAGYTAEERRNIERVREYMRIIFDPKLASGEAVAHLCAPGNRFIAPSTFPDIQTLEDYAEAHARLMREVSDLRLLRFDVLFAKGDRVCLRYTAEGSHSGAPHGPIPPSGREAQWTASAIFKVENGMLVELIKDWNKLSMWEQLGWPPEECLSHGAG